MVCSLLSCKMEDNISGIENGWISRLSEEAGGGGGGGKGEVTGGGRGEAGTGRAQMLAQPHSGVVSGDGRTGHTETAGDTDSAFSDDVSLLSGSSGGSTGTGGTAQVNEPLLGVFGSSSFFG